MGHRTLFAHRRRRALPVDDDPLPRIRGHARQARACPGARPRGSAGRDRRGEPGGTGRAAAPGPHTQLYVRRARISLRADRAFPRYAAGADPAGEYRSAAAHPRRALAVRQSRGRQEGRLLKRGRVASRCRRPGAAALSRCHRDAERPSRLDGIARHRLRAAAGRRRDRHPDAARQGLRRRQSQDDAAADGDGPRGTGGRHRRRRWRWQRPGADHLYRAGKPGADLCSRLQSGHGLHHAGGERRASLHHGRDRRIGLEQSLGLEQSRLGQYRLEPGLGEQQR